MKKITFGIVCASITMILLTSCSKNKSEDKVSLITPAMSEAFGSNIDLADLPNYQNQSRPFYINKDNTNGNTISNTAVTLGRVLFYDKNLSIDNTISCASCHQQQHGFSDPNTRSNGVSGGLTTRHSMRLINARFSVENKFFWDERAATLETQTTMPIQDHAEMGFSGQSGRPGLSDLLSKIQSIDYYNDLFNFTFGDENVTEERVQNSLAQFIRSIQSFDSKYDIGRASANNDNQPFSNFSTEENNGKQLFIAPPTFNGSGVRVAGGAGCNGCHNAPEFDIDPNSRNNGITGIINSAGTDLTNTRSPSLRDLVHTNGTLNSPLMHTGEFTNLDQVIQHYNNINADPSNTNLDPRLKPNGVGQQLNLTDAEKQSIVAFLKTLSGTNVYSDSKWGNPFK